MVAGLRLQGYDAGLQGGVDNDDERDRWNAGMLQDAGFLQKRRGEGSRLSISTF